MSWQDIVLTTCQFAFIIALLPSIYSKDKPALTTSVMNGTFLVIIGIVDLSLNLVGAALGLFVTATLWLVLAVQKYLIDQKSKRSQPQ